jgi:hypothetical protein
LANGSKTAPEVTERHVRFLRSRGYEVKDVAGATAFVAAMPQKDQDSFFSDAVAWKDPKDRQSEAGKETPPTQFEVLRHLSHNKVMHKPGDKMNESEFSKDQIEALLRTKTIKAL